MQSLGAIGYILTIHNNMFLLKEQTLGEIHLFCISLQRLLLHTTMKGEK